MIYLISNQYSSYDDTLYEKISIEESITILSSLEEISVDTETEGLDCFTKKILLLQLGNTEFQVLFDIQSFGGKIPQSLIDFMNSYKGLYVFQNAKFDWKFLFHQGILITNIYDTMLAEIILTNGLQYAGRDLQSLAEKYCGVYLDKSIRGQIITKGLSDAVLLYGAKDVEYLSIIKRKQLVELDRLDLTPALALDNSFVTVLAYVEYSGIKLDFEKWKIKASENISKAQKIRKDLENLLLRDKKDAYFSGMQDLFTSERECTINWNSPKQVIPLFNEYGIKTKYYSKGEEKHSIDAKVLDPQVNDFEILPIYLKYKEIQKIISTYGMSWQKFINVNTGRIHTTFQQLMDTGRLSSGNKRDGAPNLQNIPSDAYTRSCFIVEEGNSFIAADYSSKLIKYHIFTKICIKTHHII
ncbi:MAG: DNA polymerase [Candidatus Woesearchaeota archaeon]|jgi:DNA polymerase-1|nr:DNA polymerase [Candidatus Woesearchaeota archaeon]